MLYIYQAVAVFIGYVAFIYYETRKLVLEKIEKIENKAENIKMIIYAD